MQLDELLRILRCKYLRMWVFVAGASLPFPSLLSCTSIFGTACQHCIERGVQKPWIFRHSCIRLKLRLVMNYLPKNLYSHFFLFLVIEISSTFLAVSYSRYHPSKGYWWQFKDKQKNSGKLSIWYQAHHHLISCYLFRC